MTPCINNHPNFRASDHFIAYFDILGYENMMKTDEDISNLAIIIHDCIVPIKKELDIEVKKFNKEEKEIDRKTETEILEYKKMQSELGNAKIRLHKKINKLFHDRDRFESSLLKHKVFSDNFFLCSKENWQKVLITAIKLQKNLIEHGIFIRGSICYGSIYFSDDFICGKGIVSAYKSENELAIFPRIIMDESFFAAAEKQYSDLLLEDEYSQGYVCHDFDGQKFLNYFTFFEPYDLTVLDDTIIEQSLNFLQIHKKEIEQKLAINQDNKRVVKKYQWCKNYHNRICEKRGLMNFIIE